MKKLYTLFLLFSVMTVNTFAQGNVGIGTNTPDNSAMLDITSPGGTKKGLLIPRVSIANASIFSLTSNTGTAGMLIYNTNASIVNGNGEGFYFWNGASWIKVATGNPVQATLSNGKIWIGNVSNIPTEQTVSGDATISNVGVLDLSNGAVETSEIADNAVTTIKIADNAVDGTKINITGNVNGDLMYYNGTDWLRLAAGTAGKVLQTNGAGTAPTWENSASTIKVQNGLNLQTTTPNATIANPYVELGGVIIRNTNIDLSNKKLSFTTDNTLTNTFSIDDATFSVDSKNDRIGIGTIAPLEKLHILDNSSKIMIDNGTNATSEIGIIFKNGDESGSVAKSAIISKGYNSWKRADLHFVLNGGANNNPYNITNDTKMIIKAETGNVGIGTTNPAGKLDILGGAGYNGSVDPIAIALQYGSGGYRHFIRTRHNSNIATFGNDIDFYLNNSNTPDGSSAPGIGNIQVMTLENFNGTPRVGIGTTAPGSTLDVRGILTLNDNSIRLRGANDANHQIIYTTTVDGPSIQGCLGIEFRKKCTEEVLGIWNTTALDVQNSQIYAREGIKTKKSYYYFQRYKYCNCYGAGSDGVITIGSYDFCAVAQVGFKNNQSTSDEDDDVQCAVYPSNGGYGETANYSLSYSHAYDSKPIWYMYYEAYEDTNGVTCAANCINFE